MKVIGYTRVSTDEQADEGVSLLDQEAKIRGYCDLYGLELVEIISDPGESAKTLDRPGIQRGLGMLRSRKADGLVVAKLDRLSRSVGDWNDLIDGYFGEKPGKTLVSVGERIDTQTATGRMVLNVMMTIFQWEREVIGERTKAGLQFKKGKGERVGQVPFGYDLDEDGVHLIPNAAEQEAIRVVQQLRTDGLSQRKIVDELNARGIPAKEGGQWHQSTVRRVLGAA